MLQKNWVLFGVAGVAAILVFGIVSQAISFNNQMVSLNEMKKAELETTKVEYGQCVVKIIESNQVAKAYKNDVMELASKAGNNLQQFNQSLMALLGTQVIPQLSPELRANVQREVISCRNAYTGRVDLGLKPMYINFNRLQEQFPNSLYNALLFHWQREDLEMPKAEEAQKAFDSGKVTPLNID
jgi:hypothetical protein